jgi:hypothetical protein
MAVGRKLVTRLGQGYGSLHPQELVYYAFLVPSQAIKHQLKLSGARGYASAGSVATMQSKAAVFDNRMN